MRTYVSVDGGMSDNIRTALYDAGYTCVLANRASDAPPVLSRVVGKHCESGDIVVRDVWLPADVQPGDLLAVAATGAYCWSMASNYNHVLRPPVVAVRDGAATVIVGGRPRTTCSPSTSSSPTARALAGAVAAGTRARCGSLAREHAAAGRAAGLRHRRQRGGAAARRAGRRPRRPGRPAARAGRHRRPPARRTTPTCPQHLFTTDAAALVTRDDVDVVVEVIGGIEPARTLMLAAFEAGKSVVTANKALLAEDGAALHAAAAKAGVDLYYEAAVAGAIPLLRPLRESLAGDQVRRVVGIVNGTTNYILSRWTRPAPASPRRWTRPPSWATPRPTRPPTSRASTPPPRPRSSPRWPSTPG